MSIEKWTLSAAACTSAGKRESNEDSFFLPCGSFAKLAQEGNTFAPFLVQEEVCDRLLCGVFDGIGGAQCGGIASALAADALKATQKSLKSVFAPDISSCFGKYFVEAQRSIQSAMSCAEVEKMGSTAAILWLEDGFACAANIGDSRIYQIRGEQLRRLSVDHTPAEMLPDFANIDERLKNDALLLYLGMEHSENVPFSAYIAQPVPAKRGDVFILCTDGLYKTVDDAAICELCASKKEAPAIASALVKCAEDNGGEDNVTVVAVIVE